MSGRDGSAVEAQPDRGYSLRGRRVEYVSPALSRRSGDRARVTGVPGSFAQGRMQDYLKGGGAKSKKNSARIFLATPILIAVFSSLLARGYYFFRRTGIGSSPHPIVIGGGGY